MLIANTADSKVNRFLDQGIIVGTFIFALGSLTSKGISSIGIGLACLLWLIRIIITKNYQFKRTKLDLPILALIASIFISGIDAWSMEILDSSEKIILAILFYYAMVNTIDSLDKVKQLSYTILFSMIISAGYGSYCFYIKNKEFISRGLSVRYIRLKGFMSPLAFGGLLAIFIIFLVVYLLWGKVNKLKKVIILLLGITMFIFLVLTKTRGAWLGFTGGLSVLAWLKDKRIIIVFLIILVMLSLFLPGQFTNIAKSIIDIKNNPSNLTRIALWQTSWRIFKDHPINGIGWGGFKRYYKSNFEKYPVKYEVTETREKGHIENLKKFDHVHNNFLQFLVQAGIIALLSFIILMFFILELLYKGYYDLEENNLKLFVLASFCGVITFNIQGLTEFNFGDTETLRFFWFLIALNVIIIRLNLSRNSN
ncbi:O-antigen ligase family protein [Orenia marismortui]|uniref:O-antigen ligase n=1 Tax=Orenia marismortui TaxID=46469 RepID=A0A4R8HGB4_9FIRM|nr:O-antigen ligase family protein [Orenia marismortui]TDX59245.1 O-antigen ligase [Orenia marismortui]